MNHVELFAGIGGFRRAMDLISDDLDFNIQTVAYSEIDRNAITTYNANYNTSALKAIFTLFRSIITRQVKWQWGIS